MHIIDRRLNPGGKSLVNRQRFLRRAKAAVQESVRESLKDRSIKDLDKEGQISIPRGGIHEPTLRRAASGGNRERVFPGNRDYLEGDRIARPQGGGGGGSSAGEGESEDDFRFVLSREEFLELFLDDLELPDLAKRRLAGAAAAELRRAIETLQRALKPGGLLLVIDNRGDGEHSTLFLETDRRFVAVDNMGGGTDVADLVQA